MLALLSVLLSACNAPEDLDCLLPYDYQNPGSMTFHSFTVYPYDQQCVEDCSTNLTDEGAIASCEENCKNGSDTPFLDTGVLWQMDQIFAYGEDERVFSTKVTGLVQTCPERPGGNDDWYSYSDTQGNFFFNDSGYQSLETLRPYEKIVLEVSGVYAPQRVHYNAWPTNYPITEGQAKDQLCYFAGEEGDKPAAVDQLCQRIYFGEVSQTYIDGLSDAERGEKLCFRSGDDPDVVPSGIVEECSATDQSFYDTSYRAETLRTDIEQYINNGADQSRLESIFQEVSQNLGIRVRLGDQVVLGDWGGAAPTNLEGASVSYTQQPAALDPDVMQGVIRFVIPGTASGGVLSAEYWDTDSNYSNNVSGYTVKMRSLGCILEDGQGLIYDVGGAAFPHDSITNTEDAPDWMAQDGYTSSTFDSATGLISLGIEDVSDGDYSNNQGSYEVSLIENLPPPPLLSELLQWLMAPILDTLHGEENDVTGVREGGLVKSLYDNIVTGPLRNIAQILIILYVTFYAFGFVAGFIQISQYDFIIRVIRMLLVFTMFSDQSWEFFSTHLFNIIAQGILDFSTMLAPLPPGESVGTMEDFAFLDRLVAPLLEDDTWLRILALVLNSFYGLLLAFLIIMGILMILLAVVRAMLVYVFATIGIALMLVVSPIFFMFILFEHTRKLFDSWFKYVFGLMLQPVMVFVVIIIFSEIMLAVLYQTLSFSACWSCIWRIVIPMSDIGSGVPDISFCMMNFYEIWGDDDASLESLDGGLPVTIIQVILFLVFAHLLTHFVDWGSSVAQKITGAFGANVSQSANQLGSVMRLDKADKTLKRGARKGVTALPRKVGRDGINASKAGGNRIKAKLNETAAKEGNLIGKALRAKDRGAGGGRLDKALGAVQMAIGVAGNDKDRIARGADRRMKGQEKRDERQLRKDDPEYAKMQQERSTQERLDRAGDQRKKASDQYKSAHTVRVGAKGVRAALKTAGAPGYIPYKLVKRHQNKKGGDDNAENENRGNLIKRGLKNVGHKAHGVGHKARGAGHKARGAGYEGVMRSPFKRLSSTYKDSKKNT